MRLKYPTILFAVLAAAFLPGAAHAQDYEYCGNYVCESYAVYDPTANEISGYTRTVDYGDLGGETGLRADATLTDFNGNTVSYDSERGYGEADAYVWWAVGSSYGGYGLQGAHYYFIEDDDESEGGNPLGYTNWSVWAEPQPVIFSCGGPWYPGSNNVSVSGSGFTGQSVWITGSFVDSYNASVMSDFTIQGSVQVDSGITSATYASVYVGSAACVVVMEPSDPTPDITNVTPSPWQAGSGYTFTVSGTGFGTSANVIILGPDNTQYYNGSCSNGLSPGSQPCGDTSFTDTVSIPSNAPSGNATVAMTSNGYNALGFVGSQQLDSGSYTVPVAGAAAPPTLSCPQTVTRGDTGTCTVSGVGAQLVSSWQFTGNGAIVQGPSGSLSWSGTLVATGTVSVTIVGIGSPLQAAITVNPRSWHLAPASPADNEAILLAFIPPQDFPDTGHSVWTWGDPGTPYSQQTIGSGPNAGFTYYTAPIAYSNISYGYRINPDLVNQNSVFSQNQTGLNGCISWSDLYTQTKRHEYNSATESHWALYSNSMNNVDNNPGDYFEARVANPQVDLEAFNTYTTNAVNAKAVQINTDGGDETKLYGVNFSETGEFLGNPNFAPNYNTCQ